MKVTCSYNAPNEVKIDFPNAHQNHVPGSAEDNALLKPSAATLKAGKAMLEMGLKPAQIMILVDNAADAEVQDGGKICWPHIGPRVCACGCQIYTNCASS